MADNDRRRLRILFGSIFLAMASAGWLGCGQGECESENEAVLSISPDEECPVDSEEAIARLSAQLGWEQPAQGRELTADLVGARSTSAITICWYEIGDVFNCIARRAAALEEAEACTGAATSIALASEQSTTMCGDADGVLLSGDIFPMSDPNEPFECPPESAQSPGLAFVGRDVYPSCTTCDYHVTETHDCEHRGLGRLPGLTP